MSGGVEFLKPSIGSDQLSKIPAAHAASSNVMRRCIELRSIRVLRDRVGHFDLHIRDIQFGRKFGYAEEE